MKTLETHHHSSCNSNRVNMANMNDDIVDSEEIDHVSRSHYINEKITELKTDDSNLEKLFDLMLDMNDRLEQQEEQMKRLHNNKSIEMDRRSNSSSRCSSKPPKLHSVTRAAPTARQNMSFTNQKAKEIEKENHRLLAEIQRKKQKPKIRKPQSRKSVTTTPAAPPARVTASLVNRRRDAERIQFENLVSQINVFTCNVCYFSPFWNHEYC